ncbi:MAG: hypothetical protein ACK4UJ_08845 [Leptonema sp. (in: bacteria)]
MKKLVLIQYSLMGIIFWIILLLVALFTIMVPAQKDIQLPYYLPVILKDAQGIYRGTRVHILGVDQGFVKYLDYYPIDKERNIIFISDCEDLCKEKIDKQIILAVLNIRKQINFYENYQIYTRYERLIGEKIIEINPGSKVTIKDQKKSIHKELKNLYLDSRDVLLILSGSPFSLNLKEILISSNYADPLTIIAEVIFENRKPFYKIFKNLSETTGKINNGTGTVSLLLNNNQILLELDKTLLESILLVRELRDGLESVRENNILLKTGSGLLNIIK